MARKAGPGRPPKSPRLRRTERLQVLLTAAEHRKLSEYARARNTTVSELVRARVLAMLTEE